MALMAILMASQMDTQKVINASLQKQKWSNVLDGVLKPFLILYLFVFEWI